MEHYKIAGYGTAKAYAQLIGEDAIADLLNENLKEDKTADHSLTEVAQNKINRNALV